jgi:serine/threonine protein kinase
MLSPPNPSPQPEAGTAPTVGEHLGARAIQESGRRVAGLVPDYALLRRIGSGGYGEVWLARSKATGALRAAKIVWRHKFEDERPFQREFEGIQKFERISREHPSQLALFHIGRNEAEGYFYYVMELADDLEKQKTESRKQQPEAGDSKEAPNPTPATELYEPHTLRADLAQGRLPAARVLQIGLALAEALAHLHRHGLIHRDVKPSNVIFVNGRPKLADIGLVTDVSDRCSIVGTEGYLPPEGPGTPQADIFALGKVLYEAATGMDRREFPRLPADLRSWADAALVPEINQVVLNACTAQVQERYPSAEAMRKDLAHVTQGKSVLRTYRIERQWRTVRRVGSGLAAITVLAAAGALFWQAVNWRGAPRAAPVNDKAVVAYQRGFSDLRLGTSEGIRQAAAAFSAAIQADPQFIPARAGLLQAYLMDEDSEIPPLAERSTRLNQLADDLGRMAPTNAETHAARAIVLYLNESNSREAQNEFEKALKANSGCLMALTSYGYFLARLGQSDAARPILERARTLDPTSPLITKLLGH